eukprot:SM000163S02324  [mRNA]  locus=s163:262302:264396:+ [translate_table: standard]
MPPTCIRNPFLPDGDGGSGGEVGAAPSGARAEGGTAGSAAAGSGGAGDQAGIAAGSRSRAFPVLQLAGSLPPLAAAAGSFASLSRYRDEFHEIQEVGRGNFSRVYKVQKRLDGCLYAVKRTRRPLLQDGERRQAITEVQALAAAGQQENVVRYFGAWIESDFLYIQMELCEGGSLATRVATGEDLALTALLRRCPLATLGDNVIGRALAALHRRGIVHLDVKPENVYTASGVYKLGDFGRATRLDGSMGAEEGDGRYAPLELLNGGIGGWCLDKADMFSLGASAYELARGAVLPASGAPYEALRAGRLTLLPTISTQLMQLLKALMHPDARARPSAEDLALHPALSLCRPLERADLLSLADI